MGYLTNPLISIIVNCFNGEKYLKRALESIINQTYNNWEVVFWDNQSSDNSKKIFSEFKDSRFKYFISNRHTTLYEARNNAIKRSNGEILAFLDTDDWWDETKLEKQVVYFKDEKVGIVHSNCYLYYQNRDKKKIFQKKNLNSGFITKNLFKKYNIAILTVLLRKSAYISVSGFNNQYTIIGDFDLIIRLSFNWKIVSINECLAYYRIHNENLSILNSKAEIEELEHWISDAKIISDKNLGPYLHYINRRIDHRKIKKSINEGEQVKAFKKTILYPMGFDKIKLILLIILPKKFTKNWTLY